MNKKITNFFKSTRKFIGKHSPEILTGIGVTGMITTTVMAVKATPKAIILLEMAKDEKGEGLTTVETIKAAWKPYIPATALGVVSISCIVGASAVNAKRNAALATAYAISERTLIKYRDKVIDTIGEKKEKQIRNKVAQDEVNNKPVSNTQVIITSKHGNTLCMDSISGRYFKSDIDQIKKVVNELNRQMLHQNYISLNEFYYELGLEPTRNGSNLGWNLDDGLIDVEFGTCLAENDEPCVVLDYTIVPRYDFDKLL